MEGLLQEGSLPTTFLVSLFLPLPPFTSGTTPPKESNDRTEY